MALLLTEGGVGLKSDAAAAMVEVLRFIVGVCELQAVEIAKPGWLGGSVGQYLPYSMYYVCECTVSVHVFRVCR